MVAGRWMAFRRVKSSGAILAASDSRCVWEEDRKQCSKFIRMGGGEVTLRITLRPFLRQSCGYDFGAPKVLHT